MVDVLDSFCKDYLKRIASEAGQLCEKKIIAGKKKQTMQSSDVVSAIKLLMPTELGRHALDAGQMAVEKYKKSKYL